MCFGVSFNYLRLCAVGFFAVRVHFLPAGHASRCFSNEFRSIVGRSPSMAMPLLASQDLMPMLLKRGLVS